LCANRFGAATTLRYCPQCVREDHYQYGTGYWHRAHHLPGVQVCGRHGLSLVRSVAPSHIGNKHVLLLPPWNVRDLERGPTPSPEQLQFAQLSADALQSLPSDGTEARRAAVYQRAAVDLGFAGARARIDYELLAQALLTHHRRFADFEHRERLLATERTPLAWLRPLFTRPERATHPVCHLLVIDFLFGGWPGYQEALQKRDAIPAAEPRFTTNASGIKPSTAQDPVLDPSLTCRQAAHLAGLCVTTVTTRRRAAGLPVASRPKTLCGPMMERVRKMVDEGLSPAQIAERSGVSVSSAYRIRRERQQALAHRITRLQAEIRNNHRDAWHALGAQLLPVKAARQRNPSCYAWLYRNDREWLALTNATFAKAARSGGRVDWPARDQAWSRRADALACDWQARHPRARLSPSALLRGLGQWTARAHCARLPLVAARISALAQSRSEFQHARMSAAEASMNRDGVTLVPSRVLKRSGLRKLPRPIDGQLLPSNHLNDSHDAGSLPPKPSA
jgi:hypothetical protein